MADSGAEKSNLIKEVINIIIGGALVGLFSLFLLPTKAIEYWWLVWIVSSTSVLVWKLIRKRVNLSQKNRKIRNSSLHGFNKFKGINRQTLYSIYKIPKN